MTVKRGAEGLRGAEGPKLSPEQIADIMSWVNAANPNRKRKEESINDIRLIKLTMFFVSIFFILYFLLYKLLS